MSKVIAELDNKLNEFLSQLNETQKLIFIQLYLSSEVQKRVIYEEIERYDNGKREHSKESV